MNISVERTKEAIVIKLPLSTKNSDVEQILNYFEYINLAEQSRATQSQIDAVAKEVNQQWWENNKHRFSGKEGFEDVE